MAPPRPGRSSWGPGGAPHVCTLRGVQGGLSPEPNPGHAGLVPLALGPRGSRPTRRGKKRRAGKASPSIADASRDPCPPRRPAPPRHLRQPGDLLPPRSTPPPHPPTTAPPTPPPAPAAWPLALRPQGRAYTKTEGTRSKRECSCFRVCFLAPLPLAQKARWERGISHEPHFSCLPSGSRWPNPEGGGPTRCGPCIAGCLACH